MSELQKKKSAVDPGEDPGLKAEVVQETFAESMVEEAVPMASAQEALLETHAGSKIKAERVQERLRSMPEWTLGEGGHVIDRARNLASPFSAADYGTLVLREAARTRQKVRISLSGSRLVIAVLAPPHGRERGVIGLAQLDFAAGLL
jgi:hypothetical protein